MVLGWGKKVENHQENEEEMSMEEILASIRKYVSTDQQAPQSAPQPIVQPQGPTPSAYGYQSTQPQTPTPQTGMVTEEEISPYKTERTSDRGHTPPTLKTVPVGGTAPQSSTPYRDSYADSTYNQTQDPRQDLRQEIPPSVLEHPVTASMASRFNTESFDLTSHEGEKEMENNSGLLSSGTMTATSQAFSKLFEASRPIPEKTTMTSVTPALTLDQLIADLARPMIKTWVDQNLSKLVEGMVAQEIEKITKNMR